MPRRKKQLSQRRLERPERERIAKGSLWCCPSCGARFVTANQWHSCGRFDLEQHFVGKAASVRAAFDRLATIVRALGPVEVIAQKTRIVFLARMRFIAVTPRKNCLNGHLVLARRSADARFAEVQRYGPATFVHVFRAPDASFFDSSFAALVRESYVRGQQAHAAAGV